MFENHEQTHIHLVLNPDKLAFAESMRIFNTLKDIQIKVHRIIYNKMQADSPCAEIDDALTGIPMLNFPNSETPLIGYDTLRQFLKDNDDVVEKQLDVCYMPS